MVLSGDEVLELQEQLNKARAALWAPMSVAA